MNKKIYRPFLGAFLLVALTIPFFVSAQPSGSSSGFDLGGVRSGSDIDGTRSGFDVGGSVTNPLKVDDFCELITALYNIGFQFMVPLAVLFLVYGGLRLVFARGKPEKLTEAKRSLVWIVGGIAVFFSAFYFMLLIFGTLVALGGNDFNSCL